MMKLNKEIVVPVLKKNGFIQINEFVWSIARDGKKYAVDFKKGRVARIEEFDWIEDDDSDIVLAEYKNMIIDANTEQPVEGDRAPQPRNDAQEGCTMLMSVDAPKPYQVIETHAPAPVGIQSTYTRAQINTIRDTVAKGISDTELQMFLHIAKTYGLDPFLKEIYYSGQMKTIITSRDGYLKIAQRDPGFDGIQSMAVCENDDFEFDVGNVKINHVFGKGRRGKVIGAWAVCYHKKRRPVVAYADYEEYNKKNSIWNTYKSAMICKVAEVFALKRQFGISGLVTEEEIEARIEARND